MLNKKTETKKQSVTKQVVQKSIQKSLKKASDSKDYEVGELPEFLKNKYWIMYNSAGIKKSGLKCNEIVKKSDTSYFYIYTEKEKIKYKREGNYQNPNKEEAHNLKKVLSTFNNEKNKTHLQYNCGKVKDWGECTANEFIKYNPKNETIYKACGFYEYTKIKERHYGPNTNKSNCEQKTKRTAYWCSGFPQEKKVVRKKNTKKKSTRARMKCVPFGAKEDHATNRIMKKVAKSYCTHVTKGKVYLETMTGRYQGSVVCHYTNGNTMAISAPLYYKSGCSRYLLY
tara:strand:- start:92 stop:943 length:852 start_codon:yes stop_codon:yes gene_type:complete